MVVFISIILALFIFSITSGIIQVKKSEKELDSSKQISEAQATKYTLKEIDGKTGEIRWQLTAKEGQTKDSLEAAFIKDINVEVYKNMAVIYKLFSPYAKANSTKRDILLYGNVIASDKNGDFKLTSSELLLGMGTSIEAQNGFKIEFKNTGTIIGDGAVVNDDQTNITITNLKQGLFKDITLSGNKVLIEKEKNNGKLKNVIITNGGDITLNKNNDRANLSAQVINWSSDNKLEAQKNVKYNLEGKRLLANYLYREPTGKIIAKGGVLITHGNTECSGNQLTYENNSIITLTGNPKAKQGDKQISADKIIYNLNTGKVEALGNVQSKVANKS